MNLKHILTIILLVCLAVLNAGAQVVMSGGVTVGGNNGTVTSVGAAGLPPLFSITNPTSTPAFNFLPFSGHNFLGNCTGLSANPTTCLIGTQDTSPNWYAVDTGTLNALSITVPGTTDPLFDGEIVEVLPAFANTSATPTLTVNTRSATIVKGTPTGPTLTANDLVTNRTAILVFRTPNWELQNPQTAAAGTVMSVSSTAPLSGSGTANVVIACPTCTVNTSPNLAGSPMIGAGGQNITPGNRTGNTNLFATFSGAAVAGNTVQIDGSGNLQATPFPSPAGAFVSGVAGTGYQDVTEISAPSNPAAGIDRIYTDSSSHKVSCLTSAGGNCLPAGTGTVTQSGTAVNQVPVFTNSTNLTGLTLNKGEMEVGTAAAPVSANPGCLDVRAYYATPYNATPENEDFGLAVKNAMAAAIAGTVKGTYCVDLSMAVPSGGWQGVSQNNFLYANTNPWAGLNGTKGADIHLPDGPIVTSVMWATPASAVNTTGYAPKGVITTNMSGSYISACDTVGGCGPNNYPMYMPAGVIASTLVSSNVVTFTMTDHADCPFVTAGQIVQPTNLATSTFLNGVTLTVNATNPDTTAACASTKFSANFTHANYGTASEASGQVTATCANGSTNCLPVAGPTFNMAAPTVVTGNATIANGTTSVVWVSGSTFTQGMVGGWFISDCGTCTPGSGSYGSDNGQTLGRIVAFVDNHHLTLETNWTDGTQTNQPYAIYAPNQPVVVADSIVTNSINTNAFGHVWRDIAIDCNGVLGCIGYASPSKTAQERSEYDDFRITLQAQQTNISAPAGACAVWGDGNLLPRGHYRTSGGTECTSGSNPLMAAYTGGPGGQHVYGWVQNSYNNLALQFQLGASYFDFGTVVGNDTNHRFWDGVWINSAHSHFEGPHCEWTQNSCIEVGAVNAAYGNTFISADSNNDNGNSGAVLEFDSGTMGNMAIGTFHGLGSGTSNCIVKDDNLSTPCTQTATGTASTQFEPYYSQGGLKVGGSGSGAGSFLFLETEGTVPTGFATAGQDNCYSDSTAHSILCSFNGGSTANLKKLFYCQGVRLGDGAAAISAGVHSVTSCYNNTGSTVTITAIKCFTDNNGTSSLSATNGAATALLTGAVTCTNSIGGAAGTQSATVTIAAGDGIKFTFTADGTSKQADINVGLSY